MICELPLNSSPSWGSPKWMGLFHLTEGMILKSWMWRSLAY